MLAAIEICLAAIAVALAYVAPNVGAHWFEKVQRHFQELARHRNLAVVTVGLAALAASSDCGHIRTRPPHEPYASDVGSF